MYSILRQSSMNEVRLVVDKKAKMSINIRHFLKKVRNVKLATS